MVARLSQKCASVLAQQLMNLENRILIEESLRATLEETLRATLVERMIMSEVAAVEQSTVSEVAVEQSTVSEVAAAVEMSEIAVATVFDCVMFVGKTSEVGVIDFFRVSAVCEASGAAKAIVFDLADLGCDFGEAANAPAAAAGEMQIWVENC
jgi:hypothetical protein